MSSKKMSSLLSQVILVAISLTTILLYFAILPLDFVELSAGAKILIRIAIIFAIIFTIIICILGCIIEDLKLKEEEALK